MEKPVILAANYDVGSAQAMIPALRVLSQDFRIVPMAWSDSPAFAAFKQAGFDPPVLSRAGGNERTNVDGVLLLLKEFKPILILLGLSTTDQGTETIILELQDSLRHLDIPVAFIYETWPHGWLSRNDKVKLYRTGVDKVLAFDHFSCEEFVRNGFNPSIVEITGNPANDDLAAMAARATEIRKETRAKLGVPQRDPVLLYCTTNQDAPECNGSDSSHPRFLGFTEKEVMRLIFTFHNIGQCVANPCNHLWVRVHPAQSCEEIKKLAEESRTKVTIFGKEWPDGRPLLLAADAVLGTVTMMLSMAVFLGRPAFSCLPNLNQEDTIFSNKLRITTPLYHKMAIAGLVLAEPYLHELGKKAQKNAYCLVPNATENVCRVLREMIV